jgi:hypothetical protein
MNLEPYAATTIIPSRTRYQLRYFVVNTHDTAPMQWRQIVMEAQSLIQSIRLTELANERTQIEMECLAGSDDRLDQIAYEEKRIGLVSSEMHLEAMRLELGWLSELADEIGAHTFEQIEDDQPEYWSLRLNRQASMDQLGTQLGVNPGNLQSMLQAGLLKRETPSLIPPA